MVIEEMFGGQHRVDERKRAEQVRVTQMNGSRKRRSSCVDEEVCANTMIGKRKKLKKTLDTADVVRDTAFTRTWHEYLSPAVC